MMQDVRGVGAGPVSAQNLQLFFMISGGYGAPPLQCFKMYCIKRTPSRLRRQPPQIMGPRPCLPYLREVANRRFDGGFSHTNYNLYNSFFFIYSYTSFDKYFCTSLLLFAIIFLICVDEISFFSLFITIYCWSFILL